MDNNYSLADIRAVTENDRDDGFFGGGIGIFLVLFFMMMFMNSGMFGGGWGGLGGAAANGALTRAELQQGFDTQEITRKLDGITNGMCDGFYAQNTTMLNGFANVTAAINESRFAAQQCCCDINRNIDAVRYENAQNTCAITTAIHAEGEETRRMIMANEMEVLRDQRDQARLTVSNLTQSQYILGQMGTFYPNPPCSPYYGCGGYGYGYGYGGNRSGGCGGCGGCCNNI